MKLGTLLTNNKLEIPCVILPVQRPIFTGGKEVLVYAQNRITRGYLSDEDDEIVAEIEIVVDFAMIPELDEFIKENTSTTKIIAYV